MLAPYTIKIRDLLPDGNINTVGAKRFHCAEVLLSSTGNEARGFHDTSFHNIRKCDVYIRKEFLHQCRVVRWQVVCAVLVELICVDRARRVIRSQVRLCLSVWLSVYQSQVIDVMVAEFFLYSV